MIEGLVKFAKQRPELLFISKTIVLAIIVYSLREAFYINWLSVLLILGMMPLVVLKLIALNEDKTLSEVLRENLTFVSVPYSASERKKEIPIVTYSLILVNVFVFYAIQKYFGEDFWAPLVFIPDNPTWYSVTLTNICSMFLHGSQSHLWGNMMFLWAFGSTVEKRLGPKHFLALYLATGFLGNLLFAFINIVIFETLPLCVGASGAISGVMGLYAVRCYFKTMILPFPLFGLLSYFLPISVFIKIRVNALYIICLFVLSDVQGGVSRLLDIDDSNIAYWVHLGGFFSAVVIGLLFKYNHQALEEKDTDQALDSISKSELGTEEGEAALRRHLERNPDDPEALLILARMVSKYELTAEGKAAYTKAMQLNLASNTLQAAETYREYHNRYNQPLENPNLMYRFAAIFARSGDDHYATRVLEEVVQAANTSTELREKSLKHLVRLCTKIGLPDAAEMYESQLSVEV